MNLLLVGKVESLMIVLNWNSIEETLKFCKTFEGKEKIIKAQGSILRKGIDSIDQNANVGITGTK
jgi:hypothetical protein